MIANHHSGYRNDALQMDGGTMADEVSRAHKERILPTKLKGEHEELRRRHRYADSLLKMLFAGMDASTR
jgi:hypothetical protein